MVFCRLVELVEYEVDLVHDEHVREFRQTTGIDGEMMLWTFARVVSTNS